MTKLSTAVFFCLVLFAVHISGQGVPSTDNDYYVPEESASEIPSVQDPRVAALPFDKGSTMISYAFSVGTTISNELRVDHFFHDRWSLLYSIGYGLSYSSPMTSASAEGDITELRAPLGASLGLVVVGGLVGSCAYGYYDPTDAVGAFGFLCCVPDGVAYHIPIGRNLDLSPYVNLSGLTLQWSSDNLSEFVYAPMAGIRLMCPVGKSVVFSAEQNFKRSSGGVFLASVGLGLGVSF